MENLALSGLATRNDPISFYCRWQTRGLWDFLNKTHKERAIGYVEGLPGTGKSSSIWTWAYSSAVAGECVTWIHFVRNESINVVVFARKAAMECNFSQSSKKLANSGPFRNMAGDGNGDKKWGTSSLAVTLTR